MRDWASMREKETPSKSDHTNSSSEVKAEIPDIVVVPEAPNGSPSVNPPNPRESRSTLDVRKFSAESTHSIDSNSLNRKISTDSGVNMDQLIGEPRLAYPSSTTKTQWSNSMSNPVDSMSSMLARPKARKAGMADSLYSMSLYNNMSQDLSSAAAASMLPSPYLLNIAAAQNNMAEMIKSHEQLVNAFKQQAQYLSSVALVADPSIVAAAARSRVGPGPPAAAPQLATTMPHFPRRKARSDCTPISAMQNSRNASPPESAYMAEEDDLSSCSARSSHSLKDEGQASGSSHSNGHNASHSPPSSEASHNTTPPSSHMSSLPKRKNAMLMGPQPDFQGEGINSPPGGSPLPFQSGSSTISGNGPLPHLSGNRPLPQSKLSTASLPSSGKLANRKRARNLPEDLKDDTYWERRRKNNEAAKRSRDMRRLKEDEIACRATILEQENSRLRTEVSNLRVQLTAISQELDKRKNEAKDPKDTTQTQVMNE